MANVSRRGSAAAPAFVLLLAAAAAAQTPSPTDWRDQSVYQIVTDRFFNGDPSNDAAEGFFNPADGAQNHGGDWAGIEQKLDYIAGLGATALWISPVQTNVNAAYHGYSIRDFYGFSAHFGGLADLQSLIAAAHARGIYVILDVIANHGGDLIDSADPGYPAFVNPGTYTLRWRTGATAAPPFDDLSRYHANGHIDTFVDPNQILGELFGLDDLRTEDPSVRQDLIDAHTWLISQTDADGFRIDTVKHVELDFWQDFGPALRSFAAANLGKTNFFQYGECFDGDPAKNGSYTGTVAGGAFALDSVLWYPMYFTALGVFRDGSPTQWLSNVLADSVEYDPAARPRLLNFLDNHDNGRFMGFGSNAQRDDARARMALAWNHTATGIPLVYYGAEQEFDGGSDPWNREDMWDGAWDFGPSVGDNFDMTAPLYRTLRRLGEARQALPALRRGTQTDVASNGAGAGLYAYYRTLTGEETVLVAVNTAAAANTLVIDPDFPGGTLRDLLTGRSFTVPASGTVAIVVGGLSAAVLSEVDVDAVPWVLATWPVHDGTLAALDAEIRITFTELMDAASVESVLSITPAVSTTRRWAGRTLIISPTAPLANVTIHEVEIGAGAMAADGTPLGSEFSFFFRTDSSPGPVSVPAGWTAYALPVDDLQAPLSLETGGAPFSEGRILLGDNGWDRVFLWNDRGMVETRFADGAVGRPSALAQDAPGGSFAGDLLLADRSVLLRCRLDGLPAGAVQALATLPANVNNWIVAVDPSGVFPGAYLGRSGSGTVLRADSMGAVVSFASGLGGVNGLAFGTGGGAWGGELYALSTNGTIWRIDASGQPAVFTTSAMLAGAVSLAIDPVGNFGGHAFTANPTSGSVVQVTAAGAVSTFAGGFGAFPGGDCLAFDALGDLHVLGDIGGTTTLVKVVPNSTGALGTEPPLPVDSGIFSVAPNPFGVSTRIEFAVPPGGAVVRLSLHDVAGREIAVLREGAAQAGRNEAGWDGRDSRGRRLPSGVYFVKLRVGARQLDGKIVLLH